MEKGKNLISACVIIIVTVLMFIGCSKSNEQTNKTETKNVTSASNKGKKLALSIPESKLEWNASKVTGQHNGTVDINKGELFVDNGKLTGGNFEINFVTIKNLDITDTASKAKLTNHLKSDDFFSAEKFPIGKFEITSATPISDGSGNNYLLKGNLTIKGITKEISFPAKVNIADKVTATADFKIDRTLWDIKFRSGKFFENLGDNLISDDINIKLNIVAK